jgi:hypothetical protein
VEKNARRYSVHGTGVMSPVAKVAFVFGVSFVIMVVSFVSYYFGMTKTSRFQMRQRYLRLVRGGDKKEKDNNTQGETLRQNFFTEEENDGNG